MTEEQFEELKELLMAQLIVNSRIYDALLFEMSQEKRNKLMQVHNEGELIGPAIKYMRTNDTE